MAARIYRIVFDGLAQLHYCSDLAGRNHSLRACHLPDGMRQVQHALGGGAPYPFNRLL